MNDIKYPDEFTNKKQLENYTRNLIKKTGVCMSVKKYNENLFNFFYLLFQKHPNSSEKLDELKDICIIPNKVNPKLYSLMIIKNNNSILDISWLKCVGIKKDNLTEAMRYAIIPQTNEFRHNNIEICSFCKKTEGDFHVDHIIFFVS